MSPALPTGVQLDVDFGLGKRHGKNGGIVLDMTGSVQFVQYVLWASTAAEPNKN